MAQIDELLDLVDEQDNVIGTLPRSEVYKKNLNNFRVINAFIVNKEGKLFIPRRTADKRLCPLHLDVSIGGHVEHGETYDQAFARELKEEANLDISQVNYQLLGHLSPIINPALTAFMQVYKVLFDETPAYNEQDFVEHYWLTPKELLNKLVTDDTGKSDLKILVELFFIHQENNK